jgi:hypothetical protein
MGALLVATIIKKTPKTFDGVILSGLPTRLPPDVGNAGHTVSKCVTPALLGFLFHLHNFRRQR